MISRAYANANGQVEMTRELVKVASRIQAMDRGSNVSRIKTSWHIGKLINRVKNDEDNVYGTGAVEKVAKHTQQHTDYLYACERAYTTWDLEELLAIERMVSNVGNRFSWSHARVLSTVSRAVRAKAIDFLIQKGGTVAQLSVVCRKLGAEGRPKTWVPEDRIKKIHSKGALAVCRILNRAIRQGADLGMPLELNHGVKVEGSILRLKLDQGGSPKRFVLV